MDREQDRWSEGLAEFLAYEVPGTPSAIPSPNGADLKELEAWAAEFDGDAVSRRMSAVVAHDLVRRLPRETDPTSEDG